MALKKAIIPLVIKDGMKNIDCTLPANEKSGSKGTNHVSTAIIAGDHVLGGVEMKESQWKKLNPSKDGSHDVLLIESVKDSDLGASLKEQLAQHTTKQFTVDADVVVNTETNQFTESLGQVRLVLLCNLCCNCFSFFNKF